MRDKPRAHGPYRHGKKWRVLFVAGRGADRTTAYEAFDSRAAAQACVDGARDESQGITVAASIKAYLDVKRAQGRADLTVLAYESRLSLLLDVYLSRPVRTVTHRGAELYAAALAGRHADSHRNLLTAGGLWARWCVKQGWLKANPFADVEPLGQRVHGADKARLTVDESRKLEAWCIAHPEDQGAIMALGYLYLGTRNTELARRDVRDLDDDGTLLLIGKTKTKAGRRQLRIPEALSVMLLALCAGRPGDAPMFVGERGKRMTSNAARIHVLRVCSAAGVTPLSPQALRRTHATLATEAGETGHAVALALGQATAGTPKVTSTSYIGRDAATAAVGDRALRLIRGGRP